MPWRTPYPESVSPFRQCVSKDYHPLLGQPEGCLESPPSVVKSDKASGKDSIRFNYFQLGLGHVVRPEKSRTICAGLISANKLVNVPDVVRDDDGGRGRRPLV